MRAGDNTFKLFRQMVEVNKTILRIKKGVPPHGGASWEQLLAEKEKYLEYLESLIQHSSTQVPPQSLSGLRRTA